MAARKRSDRPFRGGTRKGLMQTLGVGEGHGPNIGTQAGKFPERWYGATDPGYRGRFGRMGYGEYLGTLRALNAKIYALKVSSALRRMQITGKKARHIDITLPLDSLLEPKEMSKLFRRAKKVLLPNGKIYIFHEDPQAIEAFEAHARAEGFSTRKRDESIDTLVKKTRKGKHSKDIIARDKTIELQYGDYVHKPLYRLECTYRLKTAMPSKKQGANIRKNGFD